jgi:hypothetical protein
MDLNVIASSAGPPIVFMLAIWFFTLSVRRVVRHFFPRLDEKGTLWSELVLPILPIVLGGLFAVVMHKFPFLDKLPSWGTRAFYGCVAGGGSGVLYRVIRVVLKKKYGVHLSTPPGVVEGTPAVEIPVDAPPAVDEEPEAATDPNVKVEAPKS